MMFVSKTILHFYDFSSSKKWASTKNDFLWNKIPSCRYNFSSDFEFYTLSFTCSICNILLSVSAGDLHRSNRQAQSSAKHFPTKHWPVFGFFLLKF